jgi:NADPH:quinone reductase-like Zn-dependent oxidoreductase
MKAAVVTRFGPPEVLQIQDWRTPVPREEEVLIKVKAIGLNFADVMARLGVYPAIPDPPFIPGIEFSGVVTAIGKEVYSVKKGDRVWGFSKQGAYAEFVCVPSAMVQSLPKKLDFQHAVAIGVTYLTAYHALVTLANLRKKERVLLHAAAGGVGIAATQIAKHLGAEIFATVGSPEKMELARAQGADVVINYSEENFADVIRKRTDGEGVDVILDSVSGKVMKEGWKLLAPMGRYVLFGFAAVTGERGLNKLKAAREALSVPIIFPSTLLSRNVGLFGFNLYFLAHKTAYFHTVWDKIMEWHAKGIIKPVIGKVFTFDRIADAQAFLQSRKSFGKVVVEF